MLKPPGRVLLLPFSTDLTRIRSPRIFSHQRRALPILCQLIFRLTQFSPSSSSPCAVWPEASLKSRSKKITFVIERLLYSPSFCHKSHPFAFPTSRQLSAGRDLDEVAGAPVVKSDCRVVGTL